MGFLMELSSQFIAGVFDTRLTENPATIWADIDADLSGNSTTLDEWKAQNFAAVWQAVNVIAGDVGQIPAITYKRIEGGGKDRAPQHPSHRLLHRVPNGEMGPFQFKFLMQARCLLWGNAYARIVFKGGVPAELVPLDPNTVEVRRVDGQLLYLYRSGMGRERTYDSSEIFHLRGPGCEDLVGTSVVGLAKESLTAALEADRTAAAFLKNDATPPVVLEFPEAMDSNAANNVLRNWQKRHGGANRGKPGLLDRGGKVSTFSMSNRDAQFLESRQFSKNEVASWFNLPPHKVGDLQHATFSNIEQQSIDYVVFSLMPWLVRWQDEANRKLFTTAEIDSDELFVEFMTAALVRGDLKTRLEGYRTGIEAGLFTFNEVRSRENMNPVEGGDRRLIPLNMGLVDENGEIVPVTGTEPPQNDAPGVVLDDNDDEQAERAANAVEPLLLDNFERIAARMVNSAAGWCRKNADFLSWLEDRFVEDFLPTISNEVALARDSIEKLTGRRYDTPIVELVVEQFQHLMRSCFEGDRATLRDRVKARGKTFVAEMPTLVVDNILRGKTNGT